MESKLGHNIDENAIAQSLNIQMPAVSSGGGGVFLPKNILPISQGQVAVAQSGGSNYIKLGGFEIPRTTLIILVVFLLIVGGYYYMKRKNAASVESPSKKLAIKKKSKKSKQKEESTESSDSE